MAFFNRIFKSEPTVQTIAAEPEDVNIESALLMHLRSEKEQALGAYLKLCQEQADNDIAQFFTAAIKAGNGEMENSVEILRELSRRISLGGETISHAIAEDLSALMNSESRIKAPLVADIIVSFGDNLKKEGFIQESAVCFEIAVGLVPNHANVLHKLGDTLHDLQMYEYAEAVLKEALKYAPYHWGALYTYAVLLQDLGRVEEAVAYYERAIKLNPDHAKCQNNYGAALIMTNRLEEAFDHCTLAAELDRNLPLAKINLGNIHLLNKAFEDARNCFTEAIALDVNLPLGYFGLGTAEEALGSEPGRIKELYLKAIEFSPTFSDAQQALDKLMAREGNPEALES